MISYLVLYKVYLDSGKVKAIQILTELSILIILSINVNDK